MFKITQNGSNRLDIELRGKLNAEKMKNTMLALFCFLIVSCSQSTSPENPDWVEDLIDHYKNEPIGNPPQ